MKNYSYFLKSHTSIEEDDCKTKEKEEKISAQLSQSSIESPNLAASSIAVN
jgi:hypothetical protein